MMDSLRRHGINEIVYGGSGSGTGREIAEAAYEAGMENIIGITSKELANCERYPRSGKLNELYTTEGYGAEKDTFEQLCDLFIAFPGGGGTISEISSMWEQNFIHFFDFSGLNGDQELPSQPKKLQPILLLNIDGSWESLRALLLDKITSGYTPLHHVELFTFVDQMEHIPLALNLWEKFLPMIFSQFSRQTIDPSYVMPKDDLRRQHYRTERLFTSQELVTQPRGYVERMLRRQSAGLGLQSVVN